MPDELTPPTHQRETRSSTVRVTVCVLVFALAGMLDGVLWRHLWSPATGVVHQHLWFPNPFDAGEQHDFRGDGTYFVVALVSGMVLAGVAAAMARGSELLTLIAVALGSVAAGLLMWRVGMLGNPADPVQLAKHAADGTRLPSRLYLANAVPLTAFPLGALGVLMAVFLTTGSAAEEPVEEPGSQTFAKG